MHKNAKGLQRKLREQLEAKLGSDGSDADVEDEDDITMALVYLVGGRGIPPADQGLLPAYEHFAAGPLLHATLRPAGPRHIREHSPVNFDLSEFFRSSRKVV